MLEDNNLSSSSDEELYVLLHQRIKRKNENYLDETVSQYTESDFMEHFRVSRKIVNDIAERFQNSAYFFHQSGKFGKLSAYDYTIIFLWFSGHEAASYRDVADRFNISLSTLRKIVERMTYFLSNLAPEVISWPTPEEQVVIKENFFTNGFPNVIGVIDGSHVRIDKPSEDPDTYLNRKGYYSIQFQVVCDDKRKIRDVMIGFPGSVHDSRVFRASPLSANLPERCQDGFILGDSGYPCLRHLLTPFKDLGNLTRRQQNYNLELSRTRYVIEHCFGILKQKFRQLYHLKLRGDDCISNFIRACCVLHNLALEDAFPFNENIVPNIEDLEVIRVDHNYIEPGENRDNRDGAEMRNYIATII